MSIFHTCKTFYFKSLPSVIFFSSTCGLLTGVYANGINGKKLNKEDEKVMSVYTNLIGYTSLGIITGITYPISFPLLTYWSIKEHKCREVKEPK
jgi:hypothetical protein